MVSSDPAAANGKTIFPRWLGALSIVLAVLALWLALVGFPGPPSGTLDDSWGTSLSEAHAAGRQFGTDYIFTYGPWGFLEMGSYRPGQLGPKLAWEIAGKLAFAATIIWLCLSLPTWRRVAFIAVLLAQARYFETVCMVFIAIAAVAWLLPAARGWPARTAAIGWLGFLALFKFVFFLEAVAVLAIVVGAHLAAGRRTTAVRLAAAFLVCLLGWWLAAGQDVANLYAYLRGSWEISSGYSWAMGSDPATSVLAAGLTIWLFGAGITWLAARSGPDLGQGLGAALIVLAVWFLAWKQGFTRADLHVNAYFSAALLLGVSLPGFFASRDRFHWQDLNVIACVTGMACAAPWLPLDGPRNLFARWRTNPRQLAGVPALRTWYSGVYREHEAAASDSLLQTTVSRATVDLIGYEQGLLTLNGLNYHPRPVPQSYSAYTPALAAADQRHFQSQQAPDFVVTRIKSIDGRYPGQDDALVLAEIVGRYDLVRAEPASALFRRKAGGGATPVRKSLGDQSTGFGQEQPVPDGAGHPIWLEADVRPTVLGRLRALVYHASPLTFTATDGSGQKRYWRMEPGTAAVGFLIDPLISGDTDLASLVSGRALAWARGVSIDLAPDAGASWFWHAPRLRFSSLPGVSLERSDIYDALMLKRIVNVRPLRVHSDVAVDSPLVDGRAVVFAHARSEIVLPVPAGSRSFSGGFGFVPGAYGQGTTDGADFTVDVVSADGAASSLFRRSLDPRKNPSDQGFQSFNLALPAGAATLRLQIGPGAAGNTDWDWTFWTDLKVL